MLGILNVFSLASSGLKNLPHVLSHALSAVLFPVSPPPKMFSIEAHDHLSLRESEPSEKEEHWQRFCNSIAPVIRRLAGIPSHRRCGRAPSIKLIQQVVATYDLGSAIALHPALGGPYRFSEPSTIRFSGTESGCEGVRMSSPARPGCEFHAMEQNLIESQQNVCHLLPTTAPAPKKSVAWTAILHASMQ